MQNVTMKIKGSIMTIEVDLSKEFGRSASGKSITIGSTQGNVSAPEHPDVKVGLNVYKSA